jgi:hypothetical protein
MEPEDWESGPTPLRVEGVKRERGCKGERQSRKRRDHAREFMWELNQAKRDETPAEKPEATGLRPRTVAGAMIYSQAVRRERVRREKKVERS